MRWRKRWAVRALFASLILPCSFVLSRWGSGNFGTVVPGRVYRSAQPSSSLRETIRERGIRTVLNLRGPNPNQAWYRRERDVVIDSGATLVDFPMSSDQWLSIEQTTTLLGVLESCEYPILVHCEWGAERTGLISAISRLFQDGSSLDDGRREFSVYYLFLPMKDGLVMRGHIDRYAEWLKSTGRDHDPATLQMWLTRAYRPGSPSREHWECNPYPLKVVSRGGSARVTTWGSTPCEAALRR